MSNSGVSIFWFVFVVIYATEGSLMEDARSCVSWYFLLTYFLFLCQLVAAERMISQTRVELFWLRVQSYNL
jgi:hypothetical protein